MRGWILSLDKTISPGTNFLAVSEFTSELLDERPNRGNEPPISYLFWAIDPLGTRSPAEWVWTRLAPPDPLSPESRAGGPSHRRSEPDL